MGTAPPAGDFMDLMRTLKGNGARGKCWSCGVTDSERIITTWTREQAAIACDKAGVDRPYMPETGVCCHCGATDTDRALIAHLKKQYDQYAEALRVYSAALSAAVTKLSPPGEAT